MKAIVCTAYGPPDVLELREVEKPTPRDTEILVRVRAATVTASDCKIRGFVVRKGPMWIVARLALGLSKPRRPIPGSELAGDIEAVGRKVTRFKTGDQILGFTGMRCGACAEYATLRENGMVAIKPTGFSYEEAAAISVGGMLALHFLRRGNIKSGQNVLVYGASGSNGTFAVQLAKHFGARVTGVCSTTNLELVRSLGADAVIDYTAEDFTKRGDSYDLIFDAVGKKKCSIPEYRRALTPSGQFISVDDGLPSIRAADLRFLSALGEERKLRTVIDRRYPIEQIVEAHRYVSGGHKKGNVAITLDRASP